MSEFYAPEQGDVKAPEASGNGVFFSNLPFRMDWRALKDLCRTQVAEPAHVSVFKLPDGRSRGLATVEFSSATDAQRAVETLNGYVVEGRDLSVRIDTHVRTPRAPRQDQQQGQQQQGQQQQQHQQQQFHQQQQQHFQQKSYGYPDQSQGYGYNTGAPYRQVYPQAPQQQQGGYGGRQFEQRPPRQQRAPREVGADGSEAKTSPQYVEGSSIFISNLPYSITWMDLKDLCGAFGDVIYADVKKAPGTNKSRGVGTVRFASADAAQAAIKNLNETEVRGRSITVRKDEKPPRFANRGPAAEGAENPEAAVVAESAPAQE